MLTPHRSGIHQILELEPLLFKKWLQEPLLHFFLIGGVIFLLYGLQDRKPEDIPTRIIISEADIDRMTMLWERKWQRLPTPLELEGLIEQQVREEVLYREALNMGLDRNDTVVRRRLAQKVEFLSQDLASLAEPSESDLAEYLDAHPEKFKTPDYISFVQIYLNTDKRGATAQEDASRLLARLTQENTEVNISASGDSFMFGQAHENLTEHGTARLFGKDFAEKLFGLKGKGWHGPIESGYGLHLVRMDERTEGNLPKLEEITDRVRDEWLSDQRRIMNEKFYNELRKRYQITVESPQVQPKEPAEAVTP